MSYPIRVLVVLLTFYIATPAGAEDEPPATPADARRTALVMAGYTPVPLALGPDDLWFFAAGTVGTETVRFLLDSGCGETVLDLAVAKRLKLELGERAALVGPSGRGGAYAVRFPGLTFGPFDALQHWNRFDGAASDLSGITTGPAGLLGIGLLHEWTAVVDYPSRTLYLRPWIATAWPRLAGTWTVTSWQEEGEARKIDPQAPPTFAFADRRLKLADSGQTREYAIYVVPFDIGVDMVRLFDPKQEGKPAPVILADGLIKIADGRMTACLGLDVKKLKQPPEEFAAPKGSGLVLLELKRTGPEAAERKAADFLRELLVKDGYTAVPLKPGADGKRWVTARTGGHTLQLLVDTGANATVFDTRGLNKWEAERLGAVEVRGLGNKVEAEEFRLRGLTLGTYDTRRAWVGVHGRGFDLSEVNRARAQMRLPPFDGYLGNLDLLTGSAVIDFGTNTLYLRPVKETLWPQLAGRWVGVTWESEGQKGRYKPGYTAVEFKGGRLRFTTQDGEDERGFHLRKERVGYRLGLFASGADEVADGFKYSSSGLLKLTGGTLTLVMVQGRVRREPTEFAAPAGSGLLLVEYERAK